MWERFKGLWPTAQRWAFFGALVALALCPVIPDVGYRLTVLLFTVVGVIKFLIEREKLVNARFDELVGLLAEIRKRVDIASPEEFSDHRSAEIDMYSTIENSLISQSSIDLCVLSFAGNYSWPFFENTVIHLEQKFGKGVKVINLKFLLVDPYHLEIWKLGPWRRRSVMTAQRIEEFTHRHRQQIQSGHLNIRVFYFDNLPHWHGLLINGTTLYLGRTEWEIPQDNGEPPTLLIGEIEYRKYTKGDRFNGKQLIDTFQNWATRYQMREGELENDPKA